MKKSAKTVIHPCYNQKARIRVLRPFLANRVLDQRKEQISTSHFIK